MNSPLTSAQNVTSSGKNYRALLNELKRDTKANYSEVINELQHVNYYKFACKCCYGDISRIGYGDKKDVAKEESAKLVYEHVTNHFAAHSHQPIGTYLSPTATCSQSLNDINIPIHKKEDVLISTDYIKIIEETFQKYPASNYRLDFCLIPTEGLQVTDKYYFAMIYCQNNPIIAGHGIGEMDAIAKNSAAQDCYQNFKSFLSLS